MGKKNFLKSAVHHVSGHSKRVKQRNIDEANEQARIKEARRAEADRVQAEKDAETARLAQLEQDRLAELEKDKSNTLQEIDIAANQQQERLLLEYKHRLDGLKSNISEIYPYYQELYTKLMHISLTRSAVQDLASASNNLVSVTKILNQQDSPQYFEFMSLCPLHLAIIGFNDHRDPSSLLVLLEHLVKMNQENPIHSTLLTTIYGMDPLSWLHHNNQQFGQHAVQIRILVNKIQNMMAGHNRYHFKGQNSNATLHASTKQVFVQIDEMLKSDQLKLSEELEYLTRLDSECTEERSSCSDQYLTEVQAKKEVWGNAKERCEQNFENERESLNQQLTEWRAEVETDYIAKNTFVNQKYDKILNDSLIHIRQKYKNIGKLVKKAFIKQGVITIISSAISGGLLAAANAANVAGRLASLYTGIAKATNLTNAIVRAGATTIASVATKQTKLREAPLQLLTSTVTGFASSMIDNPILANAAKGAISNGVNTRGNVIKAAAFGATSNAVGSFIPNARVSAACSGALNTTLQGGNRTSIVSAAGFAALGSLTEQTVEEYTYASISKPTPYYYSAGDEDSWFTPEKKASKDADERGESVDKPWSVVSNEEDNYIPQNEKLKKVKLFDISQSPVDHKIEFVRRSLFDNPNATIGLTASCGYEYEAHGRALNDFTGHVNAKGKAYSKLNAVDIDLHGKYGSFNLQGDVFNAVAEGEVKVVAGYNAPVSFKHELSTDVDILNIELSAQLNKYCVLFACLKPEIHTTVSAYHVELAPNGKPQFKRGHFSTEGSKINASFNQDMTLEKPKLLRAYERYCDAFLIFSDDYEHIMGNSLISDSAKQTFSDEAFAMRQKPKGP